MFLTRCGNVGFDAFMEATMKDTLLWDIPEDSVLQGMGIFVQRYRNQCCMLNLY
jgi:hypothetical protein